MSAANNPHLSPEGIDYATGHHHCVGCHTHTTAPHATVREHVASTWRHYLWREYPEVIATDPVTGKTIEGLVATPARRVLHAAPVMNAASFCLECFPGHLRNGCGGCGFEVDLSDEHSVSEFLVKRPDGYHHSFRQVYWHIRCLPTALRAVHRYRDELQKPKA